MEGLDLGEEEGKEQVGLEAQSEKGEEGEKVGDAGRGSSSI